MAKYPEHEKLEAVAERSQAIYDFVEFVGGQGWNFRKEGTYKDIITIGGWPTSAPETQKEVDQTLLVLMGEGTLRNLLGEFFDIDLAKIEQEKRAMLAEIRGEAV